METIKARNKVSRLLRIVGLTVFFFYDLRRSILYGCRTGPSETIMARIRGSVDDTDLQKISQVRIEG